MSWTETLFGALLIVLLLALAGYYGWRQVQTLRLLRTPEEAPPDEFRYLVKRAKRRLVGSGLMIVVAVMLGGLMIFLEGPAQELAKFSEPATSRGEEPALSPEQHQFRLLYGFWIIGLLMSLLAMLSMAALDLMATRRFSLTQRRRIQEDRRAMIERQVARLRHERNGHHE